MAGSKYSSCSTLTIGCYMYNEASLTTLAADGIYSDGVDQFTVSGGQIMSIAPCFVPPPSGNANFATTEAGVCSAFPSIVYTTGSFGIGVGVYTDISLTTPLTGFNYISFESGEIYNIDPSNGVVGLGTGNFC